MTLKQQFIRSIDRIAEYPEHYPRKYKELRQALIKRFPYAIFYLVEEEKRQIVIFGILHTRRHPETIQRRTKS